VEALSKRGLAQLWLDDVDGATATLLDLMRVTDPTASSAPAATVAFALAHAEAIGHHARAIKLAVAQLENKPGQFEVEKRSVKKRNTVH